MRPVDKGHKDKTYNPYTTAKRDLFNAIGPYCSYCERNIQLGGAVEHVQPKSKEIGKECCWDNFLLSCVNCNSTKGSRTINDNNIYEYVWPDKDDTYHMIEYDSDSLIPRPNDTISEDDKQRVQRLITLVGLNKTAPKEDSLDYAKACDTRVEGRIKASQTAKESKDIYSHLSDEGKGPFRKLLSIIIKAEGYWSVWMHTFEDVPEVREMLLDIIPGTRKELF